MKSPLWVIFALARAAALLRLYLQIQQIIIIRTTKPATLPAMMGIKELDVVVITVVFL